MVYSSRNRLADLTLVLVFLAALFLPLTVFLFQNRVQYSEVEKRELVPFPDLTMQQSITDFSRSFDGYFQDHFGLRDWFIHRYQREISKRFGINSGSGSNVFEGLDGWLFFSGDQVLDDLKGRLHFSAEEKQQFLRILTEKKTWLNSQGAAYILLVAPNKQSIYSDYLPRHYQQVKKTSRLDDLLDHINHPADSSLLDLRPRLKEHSSRVRLYDRSDTHWNAWGAYLAYQEIMDRVQTLFPDFKGHRSFDFLPAWKNGIGGDLALMIGRRTSIIEQRPVVDSVDFTAVDTPIKQSLVALLTLPQLYPKYTKNSNNTLRVLVLHDSFFNKLKPLVSESFGEVLYLWQYYDLESLTFMDRARLAAIIKLFKPDLIIEETVERHLPRFLSATSNN